MPDDCCGEVVRYDTSAALSGDYAQSVSYGAAVLSSDQPILVLVNDYPLQGNSDMATYAGIAVSTPR